MKLQFYSPHPPLKEENVGRGVEKEEDVEKKIRKFAENTQSTSSSFSFISPSVSSVSSVINFSNFLCDDYKLYVVRIDADTNVWSRDRTVDGEGGVVGWRHF